MILLFFASFAAVLVGGLVLYFAFISATNDGVGSLNRLVDVYAFVPPMMNAISEITWIMFLQLMDPQTLPEQSIASPSPNPVPSESPVPVPPEGILYWTAASFLGDSWPVMAPYLNRTARIAVARAAIELTENTIAGSLWGPQDPLGHWNAPAHLDLFEDILPINDPDAHPPAFTQLERLMVTDLRLLPDTIVSCLYQYLMFVTEYRLSMFGLSEHPHFSGQLMYFFTVVADELRSELVIESVRVQVRESLIGHGNAADTIMVIVCVIEVVVLICVIVFLLSLGRRTHRALSLLLFFSPTVALQNGTVATLLATGSIRDVEDGSSFEHAEHVVDNMREAVLLADRGMVIRDFNKAALTLLEARDTAIRGVPLSQTLLQPPDAPGISAALAGIANILEGVEPAPPAPTLRIAVGTATKIITLRTTYVTDRGVLEKGDSPASIIAVIVQMTDLTQQKLREESVQLEIDNVKSMLQRVIPTPIVSQLAEGTESVSFAIQSASIGCIRVHFGSWQPTVDDPYCGVHKLFALFDKWMKPYGQLTKVRIRAKKYIYAGGLFTTTNKPEKHAEEAARFALKIIASRDEIEEAMGPETSVMIGIHTGGPLIGGVLNAERPLFHLLGIPQELATQLAETAVRGQLHVTRAVYELIYSHNFKVTDRGDVKMQDGRFVHT
jgi:PAS domain-containing protein